MYFNVKTLLRRKEGNESGQKKKNQKEQQHHERMTSEQSESSQCSTMLNACRQKRRPEAVYHTEINESDKQRP